jgi:hypothetical protein
MIPSLMIINHRGSDAFFKYCLMRLLVGVMMGMLAVMRGMKMAGTGMLGPSGEALTYR